MMAAYTAKTDSERKDFRVAIIRLLKKFGIANEDNGDLNDALNSLIMTMEA
jgi:hypothetical protein